MKKVSLVVLLAAVAMFWSTSAFAVSGQCSDCHSMHNTDGAGNVLGGGPNAVLLTGDCVGCHTGTPAATGTPMVDSTAAPAKTLAGGNFYWVGATGDSYGHNVLGVDDGADADLGFDPPGYGTGEAAPDGNIPGSGGGAWASQLTCGGTMGCHGDHSQADELAALNGSHHNNVALTTSATQPTAGASSGASYRFLQGVKGVEVADYEFNVTAASHNQYYGVDGSADSQTISALCARCHGDFHGTGSETQVSGSWVRHPTDYDMANAGGEYAAYTAYVPNVPVASTSLSAIVSAPTAAADDDSIVACVSCHRAHGSDQPDLLRWDYAGMQAGNGGAASGTGCFACHSTKD